MPEELLIEGNVVDLKMIYDSKITAGYSGGITMIPEFKDGFKRIMLGYKKTIVVIDRSCSMKAKNKWPEVKQSISTLKLGGGNISFVFFDDGIDGIYPLETVDIDENDQVRASGTMIYPRGNTNVTAGLIRAVACVMEDPDFLHKDNKIILFTDGFPTTPVKKEHIEELLEITGFSHVPHDMTNAIHSVANGFGNRVVNDQLLLFCKLFTVLPIDLYIFGLGFGRRDEGLLNQCINVAYGNPMEQGINENEETGRICLPTPNHQLASYEGILITMAVQEGSGTMPEMQVKAIIKEMASSIDVFMIHDVSGDRRVDVEPATVIEKNDLILEKSFNVVQVSNPDKSSFCLYIDANTSCGDNTFEVVASINGIPLHAGFMNISILPMEGTPEFGETEAAIVDTHENLKDVFGEIVSITENLEGKRWESIEELERDMAFYDDKLQDISVYMTRSGIILNNEDQEG